MKITLRSLLFCVAMMALVRAQVFSANGQALTTLYSFSGTNNSFATNSDGASPLSGLLLVSNQLYGTTPAGGSFGYGTVFAINTDGTGFTNLYSFTGGSDGGIPSGSLVLSGNTLYGNDVTNNTSRAGGVFAINTDGTGFTVYLIPAPTLEHGAHPMGRLVLWGNTLYGVTKTGFNYGGVNNYANGTVFTINTNLTGYNTLYTFKGQVYNLAVDYDGATPMAGLLLVSSNALYGMTESGGFYNQGTIFQINANLAYTGSYLLSGTFPSLGAQPVSDLVASSDGSMIYGTAQYGGSRTGSGTVFAFSTNRTTSSVLHSFSGPDGCDPSAGLVLCSNTLYGTTFLGGSFNNGTVFAVNTDGTGFATLYNFSGGSDGGNPEADLVMSNNVLYGTTSTGGSAGNGTVFALNLSAPPAVNLNIAPVGGQSILFWSPSYANYILQATTSLSSPNWFNVTNGTPITGVSIPGQTPSLFFRLQGP